MRKYIKRGMGIVRYILWMMFGKFQPRTLNDFLYISLPGFVLTMVFLYVAGLVLLYFDHHP